MTDDFLAGLQHQRNQAVAITEKIGQGEAYMGELKQYIPMLNQTITDLFDMIQSGAVDLEINQKFVLQVLSDLLYGMEKEDPVYLEDVLRYGLMEIYDYIGTELQGKGQNESDSL